MLAHAASLLAEGRHHLRAGDPVAAAVAFERADALAAAVPDDATPRELRLRACRGLADALVAQGRRLQARDALELALAVGEAGDGLLARELAEIRTALAGLAPAY
jgi:hypothetical protein